MKVCFRGNCKKEFEPNKPKQVFCSDKCRVYASREQARLLSGKPYRKAGRPKKIIDNPKPVEKSPEVSLAIPATKNSYTEKLSEYEEKKATARIEVLKREIAKPPEKLSIPKRVYIKLRQDELDELENKLKTDVK
jgi:hypothetical protein